ncbi:MAG: GNAT family N-acetyltransferase [Clostridia bacterium]|nr:GNAT family N-acetyltransferase [Clostridia bacterium]
MLDELSITTPRLQIRRLENRDRDDFLRLRSMPEGFTHQSRQPREIREGSVFTLTRPSVPDTPGTWCALAVCLPDGAMIGDLWIHFLPDGMQAEIGYTLSPEHLGQGYATEAVGALLRYLFVQRGKHRVTVSVEPDHPRSQRLLERLGFRLEARYVQSVYQDGKWLDEQIYALLREEWEKRGGGPA